MHHFPLSRSHHRRETTTIVAASRILRLSVSEAVCASDWGTGVRPLFGEFIAGVFKGKLSQDQVELGRMRVKDAATTSWRAAAGL